jgi:hypothetical protein
VRAFVTATLNYIIRIGLPLLDTILIFGSFELVKAWWIRYLREGSDFIPSLVDVALPGFTLIFLLAATVAGIYDNKYKPLKTFIAGLAGIVIMLAAYSLLPEKYRFSRGVILFGGMTACMLITGFRWLLVKWKIVEDNDENNGKEKALIVGSPEEYKKVFELLTHSGRSEKVLGRIAPGDHKEEALATVSELLTVTETAPVSEIVFCEGQLTFAAIIKLIQQLPSDIRVRIHSRKSGSIVGSDSKDTSGESLSIDGHFNLAHPYQARMKRIVDVCVALFILITFPVQLIIHKASIVKQAILVLSAKKTWIGYNRNHNTLPFLPPAVLSSAGQKNKTSEPDDKTAFNIDMLYAKEYDWRHDVKVIIRNFAKLG